MTAHPCVHQSASSAKHGRAYGCAIHTRYSKCCFKQMQKIQKATQTL